ncbi:PAS domain S-box protein, partial [bacterium]|nr:PAS domain S-box protein [bacterium]
MDQKKCELKKRIQILEKELFESRKTQENLTKLLNAISEIVYQVDVNGCIVNINDAVKKYGYSPKELVGSRILDLIHPKDHALAVHKLTERRTGDRSTKFLKLRIIPKDYSEISGECYENLPVFLFCTEGIYQSENNEKNFSGTLGVVRDITVQSEIERELLHSADHYQAVMDAVPGNISWISSNLEYIGVNKHLADQSGLEPEDFVGKKIGFVGQEDEFFTTIRNFMESNRKMFLKEEVKVTRGNRDIYYLLTAQKYRKDQSAVIVGIDISRLKEAEGKIKNALKERVVLIREIHHRVKNNMQIVLCLLDMQVQDVESQILKETMLIYQSRIQAMLFIQELIYQDRDLSKVTLQEFFESTIHYLSMNKWYKQDLVTFKTEINDVSVCLNKAVPLGLLCNEV